MNSHEVATESPTEIPTKLDQVEVSRRGARRHREAYVVVSEDFMGILWDLDGDFVELNGIFAGRSWNLLRFSGIYSEFHGIQWDFLSDRITDR